MPIQFRTTQRRHDDEPDLEGLRKQVNALFDAFADQMMGGDADKKPAAAKPAKTERGEIEPMSHRDTVGVPGYARNRQKRAQTGEGRKSHYPKTQSDEGCLGLPGGVTASAKKG